MHLISSTTLGNGNVVTRRQQWGPTLKRLADLQTLNKLAVGLYRASLCWFFLEGLLDGFLAPFYQKSTLFCNVNC